MDRSDIHRRALRAALQITFIAGATGCDAPQRHVAPSPQFAGGSSFGERAACQPTTAYPAPVVPTQVATVPQRPAPVPVTPVDPVATVDSAKACTDAAALSTGPFTPPVAACCDAVLTATEAAFQSGTSPPADYFSCCNFGGGSNARHRSVCSPWGPPAPPRMRHTLAGARAASMARWS